MKHITPQEFKDAFLTSVALFQTDIVMLWEVRRDYTALMLMKVFPEIATRLEITVYNGDYYYLDSVFYSERDIEFFSEASTYAKCICVAMEHEHVIDGTAVEMNKLQLFNVPLKVLITYTQTESMRTFFLDRYAKIIMGADIFGDIATLRRQLVIFGSVLEGASAWHFYVYAGGGFQEI